MTSTRHLAGLESRQFYGELVWALVGFPPTLVFVIVLGVWLVLSAALSPLFLGVLLAAGALMAMRELGRLHRRLARALLDAQVADPPPPRVRPGLWNWLRARIGDAAAWRAFGYLLVRLPLSLLNLGVAAALVLYGLGALTYPLYWSGTDGRLVPITDVQVPWPVTLPIAVLGAAIVLVAPRVLHALTAVDRVLVFGLLGPTTLTERVRDLEESRANAIEDATVRLRRIERDLHDGAQAQLVALAMKLGLVRDELKAGNVELSGKLVDAAHGDAKQALAELRDLARGIRPPALDAGLEVALTTLAARSTVDVRVRVDLPRRPSPAMETLLYFTAAELLTNAVKHAGAPVVHVDVTPTRLRVSDEGRGGARIVPGGGLAGVAERVGTVDGRLDIDSPPGGPTVITAQLPSRS
ncbi:sensor histidine kinase [Amycolatopsis pithecellobii]|uniref:histidine kinase n=1 Tax=Amycolatopsis pithecellobii TaxID=664692 RepID=A0A6N7Z093_9PSEU|nr:sensor domain-containing protein [Amycolatopsis pithecellobii]MTD52834.1 sensor histidine kinase [Amycolatopsis pithecellobii]